MIPSTILTYRSPAKLNLMLRILNQRTDGYHNLQTIFQFIDLEDILHFTKLDSASTSEDLIALTCEGIKISHNKGSKDNLIIKAAKCLQETAEYKNKYKYNKPLNIHIRLIKKIPIGGGLGGGSSNCATTLIALNQLWALRLTDQQLQIIGRSLGADVPIFIYGHSAWAEGIGEYFNSVELPEVELGLIVPNIHIPTPLIFQSSYLLRNNSPLTINDYLNGIAPNDCTLAIFHHFPQMKALMNMLEQYHFSPHITGTGACIFLKNPPKTATQIKILNKQLAKFKLGESCYQIIHTYNKSILI